MKVFFIDVIRAKRSKQYISNVQNVHHFTLCSDYNYNMVELSAYILTV